MVEGSHRPVEWLDKVAARARPGPRTISPTAAANSLLARFAEQGVYPLGCNGDGDRGMALEIEARELYSSLNGDRWLLARHPATGDVFVRHEPNAPSGGRFTRIEIGAFLGPLPRNPEHQALLHLIGTLIEE